MMDKKNRVMIVDDQNISRQLFESFIQSADDFELVYSLDTAKVADTYCARGGIDLIIMDVVMGDGTSGLDAAARIKKSYPGIKIVIVTSMPEVSYIERAKSIGVESFWYKEVEGEPLLSVLRRTMSGESIYPDTTPVLEFGFVKSTDLTDMELMVLRELTTGAGNQEIADRLMVSVNTIRTHIQHMLDKTGFSNRTELAIEARVRGIVIADK